MLNRSTILIAENFKTKAVHSPSMPALSTGQSLVKDAISHVDEDYLVRVATDLVNIESPTGHEREAAEFYASELKALGCRTRLQEVELGRCNVLAVYRGRGRGKSLMFNGHLDTSFSPRESPEMLAKISPVYPTKPPWCYRKGDMLYGMGVFNMKSAVAAYAATIKAIKESKVELDGDIVIAAVSGEIEKTQIDEFAGSDFRGYGAGTAHLVTHGGTADYAILGEPTGLRLMKAHFGSLWVKLSFEGEVVHTSSSEARPNVITSMAKVVGHLQEWIPEYQRANTFQGVRPPVNIGAIKGGWAWRASRTPGSCYLYIDVRFPPTKHPLAIRDQIEAALSGLKERPSTDMYVTVPGAQVEENSPLIKGLIDSHKAVTGSEPDIYVDTWCSDASILSRYGIEAVNYGPTGGPGHETRGTCYVPNLVKCTQVYVAAAINLCNQVRGQ